MWICEKISSSDIEMNGDPDKKESWMQKTKVPIVVGVYSIAGLYLVRWWTQSTMPVSNSQLAFVFGTSAASSWLAKKASWKLMDPYSDSAPWVETLGSAALTWPVMYWASMDTSTANMFVPIQLVSQIVATAAVGKWKRMHGVPVQNLPGQIGACGAPSDEQRLVFRE